MLRGIDLLSIQSSSRLLIIPYLLSLLAFAGCSPKQGSNGRDSATTKNIWSARHVSPSEANKVAIAWERYTNSLGNSTEQTEAKDSGLSDAQIKQIEEGICMELPADVKTFLSVYLSNGKTFVGGLELCNSPESIIGEWLYQVELVHSSDLLLIGHLSPKSLETLGPIGWFQPYMIPIMGEHWDEVFLDIRTGNVIEAMDHSYGVMANSIADLLNEIAHAQENGKIVARYYEREDGSEPARTPILESCMLYAYDR